MADPVKPPPLEDPHNEKEIFASEVGRRWDATWKRCANAGQRPL
jgi:hypothetical protein